VSAFTALLTSAAGVFRAPSFAIFTDLITGWLLAPGRRTVTAIIAVVDPAGRRAHDAYHRFVRDGVWAMSGLWRMLATHAVGACCPDVVSVDIDDTLFHKSGRKIEGAGVFRDAVRSTARRVVYATGLNLVVVTLRVRPPWGDMPIAVPINARLHRKKDSTTTVEHAVAMLGELTDWLPDRAFQVCADGAYAALAGADLPRIHLTSRMRRDAALFEPTRRAPASLAARAPRALGCPLRPSSPSRSRPSTGRPSLSTCAGSRWPDWSMSATCCGTGPAPSGRSGWSSSGTPNGIEPDDFFFSTDPAAIGAEIASRYAGRWSIEVTFRDTKQDLGGENPQSWKRQGPERAACLALWLHGLTWCWYLGQHPRGDTWIPRPWYPRKASPSFLDALAALRRLLWSQRITALSAAATTAHDKTKITEALLDTLAYAA